jgi:hypothetical protein
MFLASNVGSPHDERQAVKGWIRKVVVLNDGLEAATLTTVIEFDVRQSRSIEWYSSFFPRSLEEFVFRYEKELSLGV